LLCDEKQSSVGELWSNQRIHLGHVATQPAENFTLEFGPLHKIKFNLQKPTNCARDHQHHLQQPEIENALVKLGMQPARHH